MAAPEGPLGTCLPKALAAELAERFEEPEAVGGVFLSSLENRLLDEGPDEPGNLLGVQPIPGTHRLCRIELEATREHREAGPQQSLVLAKKLVAPVDRPLQRLLPPGGAAVPPAPRPEPGTEPLIHPVQAER